MLCFCKYFCTYFLTGYLYSLPSEENIIIGSNRFNPSRAHNAEHFGGHFNHQFRIFQTADIFWMLRAHIEVMENYWRGENK